MFIKKGFLSIVVLQTCIIFLLIHYGYKEGCTKEQFSDVRGKLDTMIEKLIEQRNYNTKLLNLKQQKLGQFQCEKAKAKNKRIMGTGGWCREQSTDINHVTDFNLTAKAKAKNKRIIGTGGWCREQSTDINHKAKAKNERIIGTGGWCREQCTDNNHVTDYNLTTKAKAKNKRIIGTGGWCRKQSTAINHVTDYNLTKAKAKNKRIMGTGGWCREQSTDINHKAKAKNKRIIGTGGWCREQSTDINHVTDYNLTVVLASFFEGKLVGSFGDGSGEYKRLLLDSGKVKGYDAYDGAPFCDVTSEGRVQFLDLTLPQYGLPLYDWIISLEVAEHIPRQYESNYIDNIVRHAREGVVLSWAVPKQGGLGHVNNRPLEYVKNLFDSFGFSHDERDSRKLQIAATLPWLQQNTNVYRRRKLEDADELNPFFA